MEREPVPRRDYRLTLSGGIGGRPNRVILSSLSGWARPANLAPDGSNVVFESGGEVVPHWFEDTRLSRVAVWLLLPPDYRDGQPLVMRVGGRRRKTSPLDAGLIAGFNGRDPWSFPAYRYPRTVIAPGTTPTGAPSASFWNMVPRAWRMSNGDIGVVWMGGAAGEGNSPKYTVFASSTVAPKLLASNPGGAAFASPAAAFSRNGVEYVLVASGSVFEPKTAMHIVSSNDYGQTWSSPQAVTGISDPGTGGNNTGITLSGRWGNRWAFTVHHPTQYSCYINLCDPAQSVTQWTQHLICDNSSGIDPQEPAIVELADGNILALLRTRTGRVWSCRTITPGDPTRWTTPEATDIPNPNSKFDVIRLRDGRLLACGNDNGNYPGQTVGLRKRLSLWVGSPDGWQWRRVTWVDWLEVRLAQYASMVERPDGNIDVVYAGITTANANTERAVLAATVYRNELEGACTLQESGGAAGDRVPGGWHRSFSWDSIRADVPADAPRPLVVTAQFLTRSSDWVRGRILAVCGYTDPAGANMRWLASIGGDGTDPSYYWKLAPDSSQRFSSNVGSHPNVEHSVLLALDEDGFWGIVNGTRIPSSGARGFIDPGFEPLFAAFGPPGYAAATNPRSSTPRLDVYYCGAVVSRPVFVTGGVFQ